MGRKALLSVPLSRASGVKEEKNAPALHPYDFGAVGPRNLRPVGWRDVIFGSKWKDHRYKRMAIACFIQAVYLLELDRQEKKANSDGALAPRWWKPFNYKLVKTLIDDRDSSIYAAIFEWDCSAVAAFGLIPFHPRGAPRAVLALRGTLLKSMTFWRDFEDDLRLLAWESLKGSVRFTGILQTLKAMAMKYGTDNICVGGHSLGAGFVLQVGKALAKQGIFVECHLYNPPSVSLATSLRSINSTAGFLWKKVKLMFRKKGKDPHLLLSKEGSSQISSQKKGRWVPYLYVNDADYFCFHYIDRSGNAVTTEVQPQKEPMAKLFVSSLPSWQGPRSLLEAHGLQQWWSDDIELQQAVKHSDLINRQLRSLYKTTSSSRALAKL